LRVLKLNEEGDKVLNENVYFEKDFGRLRDVCVSPEGDIYISTSNRDWNPVEGFPQSNDDRIIKISANKKSKNLQKNVSSSSEQKTRREPKKEPVKSSKNAQAAQSSPPAGLATYKSYCASCHKEDGTGVPGTFPPLKGAPQVQGDKNALIRIVVQGLSGPIEVNGVEYNMEMPSFNFLSDTQIADVVEYVRSEFGNINDNVTADEVKKIKASKEK
jgi:mono/diheme cytochrome c family protein